MRTRIITSIYLTFIALISTESYATSPTSEDLAALMKASGARESYETSMKAANDLFNIEKVEESVSRQGYPDPVKVKVAARFNMVAIQVKNCLAWDRLEPVLKKAVAAEFTQEEVRAITAFYSSEAGKKTLKHSDIWRHYKEYDAAVKALVLEVGVIIQKAREANRADHRAYLVEHEPDKVAALDEQIRKVEAAKSARTQAPGGTPAKPSVTPQGFTPRKP